MKRLKCYIILGTIFVIITGTLFHFVYEWSGYNYVLGFFFPVNESTWEHMKLIFIPMLLYYFFIQQKLEKEYPCVTSAYLSGILVGTFLIPVLFYTYSGILGHNYPILDIAAFVASVILAFIFIYQKTLSCKMQSYSFLLYICVLIVAGCFIVFTYSAPGIALFVEP